MPLNACGALQKASNLQCPIPAQVPYVAGLQMIHVSTQPGAVERGGLSTPGRLKSRTGFALAGARCVRHRRTKGSAGVSQAAPGATAVPRVLSHPSTRERAQAPHAPCASQGSPATAVVLYTPSAAFTGTRYVSTVVPFCLSTQFLFACRRQRFRDALTPHTVSHVSRVPPFLHFVSPVRHLDMPRLLPVCSRRPASSSCTTRFTISHVPLHITSVSLTCTV